MRWAIAIFATCSAILLAGFISIQGDGAFKRMVTRSGVYSVCKPDGYNVVCFLDADGKDGGMFCLPLSQVGGECRGSIK